ncbi:MAG: hypothetical protein PHR77_11320 [Kiritimatiellae bacterium]|nr:hypothetical protein [Kiritimatiellia bacterium]MDD5522807.1 hypothetical protein [Kiritimatiellia bacterium]
MEDIRFVCTKCGQKLKCTPDNAGQKIECPACKKTVKIPNPYPPTAKLPRVHPDPQS